MDKIFVHVTQLRNLTNRRVGFRLNYDGYRPPQMPELPPGTTRECKQSPILRCCREPVSPWTVLVLVDGSFTGIELYPAVILDYARIVFSYVTNDDGLEVLRVEGVPENDSDLVLRLRYFGWMMRRNMLWDSRGSVEIPGANSRVAERLRDIEERPGGEHLDTTVIRRSSASRMRKRFTSLITTRPPANLMRSNSARPAPPSPTSTDKSSDDSSRVSNIHGMQMMRGGMERWGILTKNTWTASIVLFSWIMMEDAWTVSIMLLSFSLH